MNITNLNHSTISSPTYGITSRLQLSSQNSKSTLNKNMGDIKFLFKSLQILTLNKPKKLLEFIQGSSLEDICGDNNALINALANNFIYIVENKTNWWSTPGTYLKEDIAKELSDIFKFNIINAEKIALTKLEVFMEHLNTQDVDCQYALCLSCARLSEADLRRADLRRAYLQGAQLQEAKLQGAQLQGADLRGAYLQGADLQNADLQGAYLQGAKLQGAYLQGAQLCNTDLQNADLQGAYLQGAQLRNTNLQNADLQGAKLQGACLQGAQLRGAQLRGAKLQGADLQGAKLQGAKLQNADLRGAYLGGAKLQQVVFDDNTQIQLCFSDNLDMDFNHFNNHSGSILTAIMSIDSNYSDVKIDLMLQVIKNLQDKDIISIADCLEDALLSEEYYVNNPEISKFICDKLLQPKIEKANTEAVKFKDIEVAVIIKYIEDKSENNPDFMIQHSNLINQIIYHGKKTIKDDDLKTKIRELEGSYFNKINHIRNDAIGALEDNDEDFLIFISADGPQLLGVSIEYYQLWALNKSNYEIPVANAYHWVAGSTTADTVNNATSVFKTFNLFERAYIHSQQGGRLLSLINTLNLREQQKQHFINALESASYHAYEAVSSNEQDILTDAFGPLVVDGNNTIGLTGVKALNVTITDKHYNDIIECYDGLDPAQVCISLSITFTKLSSSHFFGTESESSIPIRNYALALLNKAIELNPHIVDNQYLQNNHHDWRYKLTGTDNAFSCTALLSNIMIREIQQKYPNILNAVLPLSWG